MVVSHTAQIHGVVIASNKYYRDHKHSQRETDRQTDRQAGHVIRWRFHRPSDRHAMQYSDESLSNFGIRYTVSNCFGAFSFF